METRPTRSSDQVGFPQPIRLGTAPHYPIAEHTKKHAKATLQSTLAKPPAATLKVRTLARSL